MFFFLVLYFHVKLELLNGLYIWRFARILLKWPVKQPSLVEVISIFGCQYCKNNTFCLQKSNLTMTCLIAMAMMASSIQVFGPRTSCSYTKNCLDIASLSEALPCATGTSTLQYSDSAPKLNHISLTGKKSEYNETPTTKVERHYMSYCSDLVKRTPVKADFRRKRCSTYDIVKRYARFRSDLGKRSHLFVAGSTRQTSHWWLEKPFFRPDSCQ